MSSKTAIQVLVFCGCVVAVSAQQERSSAQLAAEIAQAHHELEQARVLGAQLLDARIRSDLGLPTQDNLEIFRVATPATTKSIEEAQHILAQEDARTVGLLNRYERLKTLVDRLQLTGVNEPAPRNDAEWITVPSPGQRLANEGQETAQPVTSDSPEQPAPVRVVSNLSPIRAQIAGSSDRRLIARSLFDAGEELFDRSEQLRRQKQPEAAKDQAEEAIERLRRAESELLASMESTSPEFIDLFYLGKSRELLFLLEERLGLLSLKGNVAKFQERAQEVREPFLKIRAQDFVLDSDGLKRPGPWAVAADAALDHIRWRNLHAGYKPSISPRSIQWRKPNKR